MCQLRNSGDECIRWCVGNIIGDLERWNKIHLIRNLKRSRHILKHTHLKPAWPAWSPLRLVFYLCLCDIYFFNTCVYVTMSAWFRLCVYDRRISISKKVSRWMSVIYSREILIASWDETQDYLYFPCRYDLTCHTYGDVATIEIVCSEIKLAD